MIKIQKEDKKQLAITYNTEGNAYSGKTAHPFQKNGAPFRLKLSKAQLVN